MSIPASTELCAMGVAELARRYRDGSLSPVEVTCATFDRIERLNPELNCFISVLADSALAGAQAAERELRSGLDRGPLHGVPVTVKDNITVKGTRTTAASRLLIDAPLDAEDAPVANRLRANGAVILGKVNLHEFAFGAPDPEGPFGDVQNPRLVGHYSGQSSSGSGSSVAAGLGVISLGTDTGGSIRHPASVCGVVGLKPTYGLAPIRGIIPVSVYLDHVGPLARSVADAAAALAALAGHDPEDPYSVYKPLDDYSGAIGRDVRGLRVGVPTNPFYHFGQPAARAALERARNTLGELGLAQLPVELYRAEETNDLATLIIAVDLCAYHARHRDKSDLYSRNFRERSQQGRDASAVEYALAKEAQAEIRREWLKVFERVDVLALPANVAGASRHGQATIEVDGERHPFRMVTSRFNRASNLTGFPVLIVPIGETPEGLPISMQLIGPPFGEARLLAVGHALEQALGNLTARWGVEPRRRTNDGG